MEGSGMKSASGYDILPLTDAKRDVLARDLTAEEREVILHHGTERAFCGTLLNNKEGGLYACRLCGLPVGKQVRIRHRLAELHRALRSRPRQRNTRHEPRHGPHRGTLRALRYPSDRKSTRLNSSH